MTKKELIIYIESNSTETDSWGNLPTMNKPELEQIYNYLVKVNENGTEIVAEEVEEEIEEEVVPRKKVDPVILQEYIEHKKPSGLSASERKAYARTGILLKKKENKYTRFEEEEVKFGF